MKSVRRLKHDENFKKRFRYILELVITLPIGAITAYVFEQKMIYALFAIAVFFVLFFLYCLFLVAQENKVSVLSIMSEGLRDGRYEDVIKFGSAMSPTLFTSNKNLDRVKLGRILFEACTKLSQTEHSARDGIVIASGGAQKTVKQIKIELLLDDLGWSLYLTDHHNKEATSNIQEAIKLARLEIKRLKHTCKNDKDGINDKIEIFMNLIMRGYRHLTGIYFSDQKTLDLAKNYERVTQYILSNGRILAVGGVCSSRIENLYCGMICSGDENKITCTLKNIQSVYFSSDEVCKSIELSDYIDIHRIKLNEIDLIEDKENFNLLPLQSREKVIREQSYAWSRNTVKWLQKSIHNSWDVRFAGREMDNNTPFVSDDERNCKVSEAVAFARLYYYGLKVFELTDYSDFDEVISTNLIKKEQQRYLTLINEISIIGFERSLLIDKNLNEPIGANDSQNNLIDTVIDHIKQTRDACRGLRADLFARNTSLLMKAIFIRYNLNVRYNMGDENTQEYRLGMIKNIIDEVKNLYLEVIKYEHCDNEEVRIVRDSVVRELMDAKKELRNWTFVFAEKPGNIINIENAEKVSHLVYSDNPSKKLVDGIKNRWNI